MLWMYTKMYVLVGLADLLVIQPIYACSVRQIS